MKTERELISICLALIDKKSSLSAPERQLKKAVPADVAGADEVAESENRRAV